MAELKTIKESDIESNNKKTLKELVIESNNESEGLELVGINKLWIKSREEAIKWIKELESEKNRTEWTFLPNFYKFDEESIIFWIKHFFNISEEI